MVGGGAASLYDRLEDVQFFEEEVRTAVHAAENAGTYVMVHVYVPEGIRQAIRAGVKSIEHGHLIDEETMKMIADNGVWLSMQPFTADDNTYPNEEQQRKHETIVAGTDNTYKLAKKYGVRLAWGTDLLFNPAKAKDQNRGIAKLARWFSNYEILKMVTRDNAELLALSGRRNPYPGPLGTIETDALADLLLVDGNPLENIELLTEPGEKLSADRQRRNDIQATGRLRAPDPREAPRTEKIQTGQAHGSTPRKAYRPIIRSGPSSERIPKGNDRRDREEQKADDDPSRFCFVRRCSLNPYSDIRLGVSQRGGRPCAKKAKTFPANIQMKNNVKIGDPGDTRLMEE